MANIFVIGIGGTGMRCIEAFTHLCAIGMLDNTDVHLLALDTDKDNGNFTRLKNLKEAYIKAKGINKKQFALKDTFFSANLHYYQFSPDYSRQSTFDSLYDYSQTKRNDPQKSAIADLLFTDSGKEFDLKHGYRAQTHLGSMLMYHSILAEAEDSDVTNLKGEGGKTGNIKGFIDELANACQAGNPRVFILGSIFGGTGASSIPIIPKALIEGAKKMGVAIDISSAYFGATLLTSYFSFPSPNATDMASQKVIATSDKFALNSQAAMMFYEVDETVKKTYQRFYMMGTDGMDKVRSGGSVVEGKTITGGKDQTNDCHYIELLSAFAAWDFFNSTDNSLSELKDKKILEYLYRTFEDNGKITFEDFVGSEKKEELAKKLGLFTAMSYLTLLEKYDFFEQAQRGDLKKVKIEGYEDIDKSEVGNLKTYMKFFHFDPEGKIEPKPNEKPFDGWLRQIHRSAGAGDKFLLNAGIFSSNSVDEMVRYNFNTKLYQQDSEFENKKFKAGLITDGSASDIYDKFVKSFINSKEPENITNKSEKLIKRVYDTLCQLYNFKN
jgi:hypothetical protein